VAAWFRSSPSRADLIDALDEAGLAWGDLRRPADLAGVPIAVGLMAGSHYNVPYRLERHLPLDAIEVAPVGGFGRRLEALLDGEVEAASLLDPQIYMVFTPGQLRVRQEIGGGEAAYDTAGMVIQKQRNDLFRHWILGLGSGDLVVNTSGATAPRSSTCSTLTSLYRYAMTRSACT